MSGIYLHIPFCKQACHYCDFHFSTSLKYKTEMVSALVREIGLRKEEFKNERIETIYFGGGTPSILTPDEIGLLIRSVYANFEVASNPEITLEANPDDLSQQRIVELSSLGINRLSIGIQSFFDIDLKMMNRAHCAAEAQLCLTNAKKYFDNISIDLIYGIPGMSLDRWKQNIETALSFEVPHISTYALTVEPKTALQKLIQTGRIAEPSDAVAQEHFTVLMEKLGARGYVHYELSNFGQPDYFSRNNTAYWLGKKYMGIGPSAHSFDGFSRKWNVSNNNRYLKSMADNQLSYEAEVLTATDRYNEYIMTGLRTIWGVSLERIKTDFGSETLSYLLQQAQKFLDDGLLQIKDEVLVITNKGKFLADGIASDLFLINLD